MAQKVLVAAGWLTSMQLNEITKTSYKLSMHGKN